MSLLNDILEHKDLAPGQLTAYIDEYASIQPYDCMIDTARAVVALFAQDYQEAEKWILSALEKNPSNYMNHFYYALILKALGQYAASVRECWLSSCFATQFELPPGGDHQIEQLNGILTELGPKLSQQELDDFKIQRNILRSCGSNFPQYFQYDENQWTVYQGRFLYYDSQKTYNDYICLWPQAHLDGFSYVVHQGLIQSQNPVAYSVTPVESWKALKTRRFDLDKGGYVLAVAGTQFNQSIAVVSKAGVESRCNLEVPNIYHYLNMEQAAALTSNQDFIVSKPIPTTGTRGKKRLVLALFMDGLAQQYLFETGYRDMPHTRKFFDGGMIFNHCHATAEWTLPSVPALQTGLYTTHHHIIYHGSGYRYPARTKTAAEIFQENGYFTVRISGSRGSSPYFGGLRGFDSSIHKSTFGFPDSHLIADALDYMDAFPNTNQFISLELFDSHRSLEENMDETLRHELHLNMAQQTAVDAQTSLAKTKTREKSVRMRHEEFLVKRYQAALRQVDRQFKTIFDYITSNYREDEYVVCLYSDHGMAPLNQEEYLLKTMRTNSVLMLRGAGVSAGISEEYINHIDYLPILTKLAGIDADFSRHDCVLPRTFGGPGRDYVYTESIYQGQTYKAAVRTDEFECRFEANVNTDIDGLIDLSKGYTQKIFSMQTGEEIHDAELAEDFEGIVFDHIKENIKY